jgi:hypothetical protein
MAAPARPIPLTPAQAENLSHDMKNDIYSALLSGTGVLKIEATLSHELQRTGWLANLRQYVTHLLRTGEASTIEEIMVKVRERMALDRSNGAEQSNGAVSNGVNGANGHDAFDDIDLKVPTQAITEGAKTVRSELEKICDVTYDK